MLQIIGGSYLLITAEDVHAVETQICLFVWIRFVRLETIELVPYKVNGSALQASQRLYPSLLDPKAKLS